MAKTFKRILDLYINILASALNPAGYFAPIVGASIFIGLMTLVLDPFIKASQIILNIYKIISATILLSGAIDMIKRKRSRKHFF